MPPHSNKGLIAGLPTVKWCLILLYLPQTPGSGPNKRVTSLLPVNQHLHPSNRCHWSRDDPESQSPLGLVPSCDSRQAIHVDHAGPEPTFSQIAPICWSQENFTMASWVSSATIDRGRWRSLPWCTSSWALQSQCGNSE